MGYGSLPTNPTFYELQPELTVLLGTTLHLWSDCGAAQLHQLIQAATLLVIDDGTWWQTVFYFMNHYGIMNLMMNMMILLDELPMAHWSYHHPWKECKFVFHRDKFPLMFLSLRTLMPSWRDWSKFFSPVPRICQIMTKANLDCARSVHFECVKREHVQSQMSGSHHLAKTFLAKSWRGRRWCWHITLRPLGHEFLEKPWVAALALQNLSLLLWLVQLANFHHLVF